MAKFIIDAIGNVTISMDEIPNDKFPGLYSVVIDNDFYNQTVRFGINKNQLKQLINFLSEYLKDN